MTLKPARPTQKGDPVIILQHPKPENGQQMPMQVGMGTMLESPWGELRSRYDALTLPGSSGSPCFDATLALVGLHHCGDPDWQPAFNQAIPINAIVQDLQSRTEEFRRRGAEPFWSV